MSRGGIDLWHKCSRDDNVYATLAQMEPYADNIVTFRVLLGGYEQAVERFGQASRNRDAVQVFGPLFEALNLAVALDDQARAHWAPEGVPLDWAWRTRVTGGTLLTPFVVPGIWFTTSGRMRSGCPKVSAARW